MQVPGDTTAPPEAPQQLTYEDIASMIEHCALAPEATDNDVRAACDLARAYRVAAIVVRPCDADAALRWMENSAVAVASVVSYPHGFATTPAKLYEARDLLRRGVKEIDVTAATSKLLAREFHFLETELQQIANSCRESGAILKVTFHTDFLAPDLKTIACKIVKRVSAQFVRTTSRLPDEVRTLARLCGDRAQVATGCAEMLQDVLDARDAGASRVTTSSTALILDAWRAELATQQRPSAT